SWKLDRQARFRDVDRPRRVLDLGISLGVEPNHPQNCFRNQIAAVGPQILDLVLAGCLGGRPHGAARPANRPGDWASALISAAITGLHKLLQGLVKLVSTDAFRVCTP